MSEYSLGPLLYPQVRNSSYLKAKGEPRPSPSVIAGDFHWDFHSYVLRTILCSALERPTDQKLTYLKQIQLAFSKYAATTCHYRWLILTK